MAATVQWFRSIRAIVCDSCLQIAVVALLSLYSNQKLGTRDANSFPEGSWKLFICFVSHNWDPMATLSCNGDQKRGVFSLPACLVEGERKKELAMDVELASQQFLCNASVWAGSITTSIRKDFSRTYQEGLTNHHGRSEVTWAIPR